MQQKYILYWQHTMQNSTKLEYSAVHGALTERLLSL